MRSVRKLSGRGKHAILSASKQDATSAKRVARRDEHDSFTHRFADFTGSRCAAVVRTGVSMQHTQALSRMKTGRCLSTNTAATLALFQRRCVSHTPTPSTGGAAAALSTASVSASSTAATSAAATSPPSRRRFAHRQGPAKRASLETEREAIGNDGAHTSVSAMPKASGHAPATPFAKGAEITEQDAGVSTRPTTPNRADVHSHAATHATPLEESGDAPTDVYRKAQGSSAKRTDTPAPQTGVRASPKAGDRGLGSLLTKDGESFSPSATAAVHPARTAPPAASSSSASDGGFRLPDAPDAATATPAALCSYMLTLRRVVSSTYATAPAKNSAAKRALISFVKYTLPTLMQPPPTVASSNARGGHFAASLAGDPLVHPHITSPSLATDAAVRESLEGVMGSVSWTKELAESTLLCAGLVKFDLSRWWATESAIEFLLYNAAHPAPEQSAKAVETLSAGVSEQDAEAQRIAEATSFTTAMLHAEYVVKRRRRIRSEILAPVGLHRLRAGYCQSTSAFRATLKPRGGVAAEHRSAIQEASTGAAADANEPDVDFSDELDKLNSDVEGTDASSKLSLSYMTNSDQYVYDYLLPSLFEDLRRFCAEMERRYDAAVDADTAQPVNTGATGASSSTSSTTVGASSSAARPLHTALQERYLCRATVQEQEMFAALLSVFTRVVSLHGVKSTSVSGFFFQPHLAFAPDGSITSGQKSAHATEQAKLSLRAFTVALSSIAATLHDSVGPDSGRVKRTMAIPKWQAVHNRSMSVFDAENEWDRRTERKRPVRDHRSAVSASASLTRVRRFQQRSEHPQSRKSEGEGINASEASSARSELGLQGDTRHAARSAGDKKSSASVKRASAEERPHYNIKSLLLILRFCSQEHALRLLMDTTKVTRDETGNGATSRSTQTHARTDGTLADCVDQIALAQVKVLQVSLYWGPLCRTHQLPSVVHAFARLLHAPPHAVAAVSFSDYLNITSNSLRERTAEDGETLPSLTRRGAGLGDAVLSSTGPVAASGNVSPVHLTIDDAVRERAGQLLQQHQRETGDFPKVARSLFESALRYARKQKPETFASTAFEFDQLLSRWPGSSPCDTVDASGVLPSTLSYPVPSSATAEVALFADFLRQGWTQAAELMFWASLPTDTIISEDGSCRLRKRMEIDGRPVTAQVRRFPALRLTVLLTVKQYQEAVRESQQRLPSANEATVTAGESHEATHATMEADVEGSAVVEESLTATQPLLFVPCPVLVPHFVATWMSSHTSGSITAMTPSMLTRILRATDRAARFFAIPSGGGRVAASLSVVQDWYKISYAQEFLTGQLEAFLSVHGLRMQIAAVRLSELLHLEGKMEAREEDGAAAGGTAGGVERASFLEASRNTAVRSAVPFKQGHEPVVKWRLLQWMSRINPHALFLSRDGRICSSLATAMRTSTDVQRHSRASIAPSTWSSLLHAGIEVDAVRLARNQYDSFTLWPLSWREPSFSGADVAALLRAMHLIDASVRPSAEDETVTQATTRCGNDDGDGSVANTAGSAVSRRPSHSFCGFYRLSNRWEQHMMMELLLRIAHRFLFVPQTKSSPASSSEGLWKESSLTERIARAQRGTDDTAASYREEQAASEPPDRYDDTIFAMDSAASLETLVLLYIALLSTMPLQSHAAQRKAAKTPPTLAVGRSSGKRANPELDILKSARYATALRCCLAECETLLQERLRSTQQESPEGRSVAAAAGEVGTIITEEDVCGEFSKLEALLEMSILVEQVWPDVSAEGLTPEESEIDNALPRKIVAHYQHALAVHMRTWSSRDIAGVLSNHLWWTTQHQSVSSAAVQTANQISPHKKPEPLSWVEETLLDVLEERLLVPKTNVHEPSLRLAAEAPSLRPHAPTLAPHRPFDVFEWVLMPFYLKVEQRHRAKCRANRFSLTQNAIPAPTAPAAIFDDFTSLEDAFVEDGALSWKAAGGGGSSEGGSTSIEMLPSRGSASFATALSSRDAAPAAHNPSSTTRSGLTTSLLMDSTLLLEKALDAVTLHCKSFDVLVHVVRHLFLAHPASLSTAPDAALQLEASHNSMSASGSPMIKEPPVSRIAEISSVESALRSHARYLPLQCVTLSQSLRRRYVETLFRTFRRLVYQSDTTLDDVVELLHVLWLADPQVSRLSRASSVPKGRSGQDGNRYGDVVRASGSNPSHETSQPWPSLYTLCADFIREALLSDLESSASSSHAIAAPPVIFGLRSILDKGVLPTLSESPLRGERSFVTCLRLSPASVLLFLRALTAQVHAERVLCSGAAGQEDPPSLTPPQRSLLEMLEPLVLYSLETSELLSNQRRSTVLPAFLELLSDLDPRLVLTVMRFGFAARNRGEERIRRPSASLPRKSPLNALPHRKRFFFVGDKNGEEHARSTAALVSAILLLASRAQISSGLWAAADESATVATDESDVADELSENAHGASAVVRKKQQSTLFGGAHHRAIRHLLSELHTHVNVPQYFQPLRFVDPDDLLQLLQLTNVRRHHKLSQILSQQVLRMLTTVEVDDPPTVSTPQRGGNGGSWGAAGYVAKDGRHFRFKDDGLAVASSPRGCGNASLSPLQALPARSTEGVSITPVGRLLLRRMPFALWRELFNLHIVHPPYMPYMRREKLAHMHAERRPQRHDHSMAWREDVASRSGTAKGKPTNNGDRDECGVRVEGQSTRSSLPPTTSSVTETKELPSLATVLLTLNAAAARSLATEVMSPSILFAMTARLMQLLWWSRSASAVYATTPMYSTSPASSYAILLRYASAQSILRDTRLQPFLMAACEVLDQMASSEEREFVAVLNREAVWRRDVKDGATARQSMVANALQASLKTMRNEEDDAATPASAGSGDDSEASGGESVEWDDDAAKSSSKGQSAGEPVLVIDWQPIAQFVQMLYRVDPGVAERQLRDAVWAEAESPSPSPPELRDAFHQGIDAILERVGALWRASSTAAGATVGKTAVDTEATCAGSPRLLVMNMNAVLNLYTPFLAHGRPHRSGGVDGRARSWQHSAKEANSVPGNVLTASTTEALFAQEVCGGNANGHKQALVPFTIAHATSATWLDADTAIADGKASSDGLSSVLHQEAQLLPIVCTYRSSKGPPLPFSRQLHAVAVEVNKRARRAALLQRAGLLLSPQEPEDQGGAFRRAVCVSTDGTPGFNGAAADMSSAETVESAGARKAAGECAEAESDAYWREKRDRVHERVLESVFPSQRLYTQGSSSVGLRARNAPQPSTLDAEASVIAELTLERQARQHLELMRSEDVAQLLRLLLSGDERPQEAIEKDEDDGRRSASNVAHALSLTKSSKVRVLLEALADLLPSASPAEVLSVTQDLLQLYVHLSNLENASSASSASTTTSAREDVFEVRKVLSNVGVLIANDVERFSTTQLIWLLTRLHTPQLRGVRSTPSSERHGESPSVTLAATHLPWLVDVSESFLSSAVARSIAMDLAEKMETALPPTVVESDVAVVTQKAVTVVQWTRVVTEAELRPSLETVTALLSVIEASAL